MEKQLKPKYNNENKEKCVTNPTKWLRAKQKFCLDDFKRHVAYYYPAFELFYKKYCDIPIYETAKETYCYFLEIDIIGAFDSITYSRIRGILKTVVLNPDRAKYWTNNNVLMRGGLGSSYMLAFILFFINNTLQNFFGNYFDIFVKADQFLFCSFEKIDSDILMQQLTRIFEQNGFKIRIKDKKEENIEI